MKKNLIALIIFSLVFGMFGYIQPLQADENDTDYLIIDLDADANYNGLLNGGGLDDYTEGTASDATTEPEVATSTADEFFFSFKTNVELGVGETVVFTFPTEFSGLANCTTASATTKAQAKATADGSFGIVDDIATYTISATTTSASTTGMEFCLKATTPATGGNYVVKVISRQFEGAKAFIYVGDKNDVVVTADVYTPLFFKIRNTTDTADENTCDLGTLNSANVNECAYRLAISTSAATGFVAYTMSTGSTTAPGLANTVTGDEIANSAGATVFAGVEGYGVAVGNAIGLTEAVPFNDDDASINQTAKTQMLSVATGYNYVAFGTDGDLTDTTLITHRASVDDTTPAGSYSQTVSYYVTSNY